jgi:hydrogenase maturation protease
VSGRLLVAGLGNVFLGDDAFGVEVVRCLALEQFPDDVVVMDVGIRGVHLAYELLDGYDALVLVDAVARGDRPGTVTLLEPEPAGTDPRDRGGPLLDPHRLEPDALLAAARALGAVPATTVIVGCEPAVLDDGIGLSPVVAQAVAPAVAAVRRMIRDFLDATGETAEKGHDHGQATARARHPGRDRGGAVAPTTGHRALPPNQGDVSMAPLLTRRGV